MREHVPPGGVRPDDATVASPVCRPGGVSLGEVRAAGAVPGHFVGHFLGHFETPIVSRDFTRVRRVSPLFLAVGTLGTL